MDDVSARKMVLNAVAGAMHLVVADISEEEFISEAEALMTKWSNEHSKFGKDGIVDALVWWQDQITDDNVFPLSRGRKLNG
jgi:hypothetical protein